MEVEFFFISYGIIHKMKLNVQIQTNNSVSAIFPLAIQKDFLKISSAFDLKHQSQELLERIPHL